MARITAARLEELKRRARERQPYVKAWQYLELVEGESRTEEQSEILKRNLESAGNGAGYRYMLVAEQVKPFVASEDLNAALDELNELGVLDSIEFFEDGREN
jgi:hypothetical protein